MSLMPAILASHLSKSFGGLTAVDDLSFEVKRGEVFGFLGLNGAGKTTTVHMLTTLVKPSAGSLSVLGDDVVVAPERVRQHIAVVMQDVAMEGDLTARETVLLYGRLYGVADEARVDDLLSVMGLSDRRDDLVGTFSGGMKRKLEIARALIGSPRVLFLDEPTTGLDPKSRRDVWEYIRRLTSARDITVFLTTHYIEEAESLCDRVGIIDRGRLVVVGTPAELKKRLPESVMVDIRALPPVDRLACALGSRWKLEADDGLLRVELSDADVPPFLVRLARALEEGGQIESIRVKEVSLEDVFLRYASGGEPE